MHQFGPPITLHLDEPFYVGIGFCLHLPATSDTVVAPATLFWKARREKCSRPRPVLCVPFSVRHPDTCFFPSNFCVELPLLGAQ